jgi:hypothetical protein
MTQGLTVPKVGVLKREREERVVEGEEKRKNAGGTEGGLYTETYHALIYSNNASTTHDHHASHHQALAPPPQKIP